MNRRAFLQRSGAGLAALAVAPSTALRAGPSTTLRASPRWFHQARPRPTAAQLAWQRDELALFLHFGVNTFTDREWGDGREDPAIFAPAALDARAWARTARGAGFRAMILTAKHHDGFCLWPTNTTTHSVAKSPWRGGRGDVVREFVDACRAEGLGAGLYLSPWDRNHPAYGDSPRYNDVYADQLTELLTQYGRLNEVWFDGANGEGPNGKRQVYDWPRTFGLVKKLQPNAVDLLGRGARRPLVRQRERHGRRAELVHRRSGASGGARRQRSRHHRRAAARGSRRHGVAAGGGGHVDSAGLVSPSGRGRAGEVGRPPLRHLLPVGRPQLEAAAERAADARRRAASERRREPDGLPRSASGALRGGRRTHAAASTCAWPNLFRSPRVRLEENIEHGQSVARFSVLGEESTGWRELARGATIGYARIERFAPVTVSAIRVVVEEAIAPVAMRTVTVFGAS